jgi:hypothetical protein
MTDNLQEKNQQVLNNISQLQLQEKQLYDSLNDITLTTDQKQQIINKINEISQIRMNMYSGIKDMYSYYQKNVETSRTTLSQELLAIDILENELNQSKRRLNALEDEKANKLRLVEINTYYGKRYNAHTKLMKIIVITCIPIIILSVLANIGFLPSKLYTFLTGIVIVIGGIFVGLELIDFSNRDNMNWDEYNWYFDKSQAPSPSSTTIDEGSSSTDPWETPTAVCVGSACCYDGSTYDEQQNICVPTQIYNKENPDTSTSATDSTTETFNTLEKYANTQDKPVYNNNIIIKPRYASYK